MSLELIDLNTNLKNDVKKIEIRDKIIERINKLFINIDIAKYKSDVEFLLLIAELIEFLVTKKDNINKKELMFMIFENYIVLSEDDRNIIEQNLKFVHTNKLIKKVSFYKLFCSGLKEFFIKRSL